MRQMTDNEGKRFAEMLTKRQQSEWCDFIFRFSVGRSMQQVADLLGYTRQWVAEHLKRYALEHAAGGGKGPYPLQAPSGHRETDKQVAVVVRDYAPAEPDEEYVAEYEAEGHTPEVAKCLANAYEAGENAIEAGVIQETVTKQNERASKIVLPSGVDWEMRLRRACSDVKSAAGLLDRANISDLKRATTRKQVAAAHVKWMEQIERIENFHSTFNEEISSNEA